jgi:hypothetical protein
MKRLYTYKSTDGKRESFGWYPIGEQPDRLDGLPLVGGNSSMRRSANNYPLISEACGVLPHQIPEAERLARKHGVNTEYVKGGKHPGQAIFRDPNHRRRHMAAFGQYDQDAGYRDRPPSHK